MSETIGGQASSDAQQPYGAGAKGNGASQEPPSGTSPVKVAEKVADIQVDAFDGRKQKITDIFHKRRMYAIYEAGGRVMIQHSDDEPEADSQIGTIADLLPDRDRLQYIIAGMRSRRIMKHNCYRAQIAEALRLGLEGRMDVAKRTLKAALDDCIKIRERNGRFLYVALALFLTILASAVLLSAGFGEAAADENRLMLAAGAGAIGAFISVAIAIRRRTIALDNDWLANGLDSGLRILIGTVSGAVLYLLLAAGILADISVAGSSVAGDGMDWKFALLIGFAAGFVERMVPELLDKEPTSPSNPTGDAQNSSAGGKGEPTAAQPKPDGAGQPQAPANGSPKKG